MPISDVTIVAPLAGATVRQPFTFAHTAGAITGGGGGGNTAPTVAVTGGPATGGSVPAGTAVTYTATAADAEDGALTAAIGWFRDDVDTGVTGGSYTPTGLTAGQYTIQPRVTDAGGLTGVGAARTLIVTAATQYLETFAGEAVGAAPPSDFAAAWDAVASNFTVASATHPFGDRQVDLSAGTAARRALRYVAAGNVANGQVLARVTTTVAPALGTAAIGPCLVLRGSGTGASENGYLVQLFVDTAGNNTLRVQKHLAAAAAVTIGTGAAGEYWNAGSPGPAVWLRATFDADTITVDLFDGAAHTLTAGVVTFAGAPLVSLTVTDASIAGAGWVGLFTGNTNTHTVERFSVGVGSGVAAP